MAGPLLVTGCAGFIGYHVCLRLLRAGRQVVGLDNLNDYYDPKLKLHRLEQLSTRSGFVHERLDLREGDRLRDLFRRARFEAVVHLAAQAGVRYSLEAPGAYIESNLTGFGHLLEACRWERPAHVVFASSSSVYGANTRVPFRTQDNVDHPLNLYAATKKANELMAHSYAHLFGLPMTGLRFFTVYGPWGRPDMAMSLFADAILSGSPLRLFNAGRLERDYTFVEDAAEAVARLVDLPPTGDPAWSGNSPDPSGSAAPWRILNVASGRPVAIREVVRHLEREFGTTAQIVDEPAAAGDMPVTHADIEPLVSLTGFRPTTSIGDGIARFAAWYRAYHPGGEAGSPTD